MSLLTGGPYQRTISVIKLCSWFSAGQDSKSRFRTGIKTWPVKAAQVRRYPPWHFDEPGNSFRLLHPNIPVQKARL